MNLAEVLRARASDGKGGITFITKSDQEEYLSYESLYHAAVRALAYIQKKGVKPGDELVFQVAENRCFVITFWACILGGIIPVPLSIGQTEDHRQKLFNVWSVLRNPFLITSGDQLHRLKTFARERNFGEVFDAVEMNMLDDAGIEDESGEGRIASINDETIAFIQFSSGSTGQPKGVVLTHKNLIINLEAISEASAYTSADSMLSWMPLTHDMGLIGFHLNPLFCGMNQFLMPPQVFVRRPDLWLEKASQHKVTILCSPNFGYEYTLKHGDSGEARNWDLSAVRIIYNGAEPISESLCRRFLNEMSKYRLRAHSMCPVYGLAEASLAVSISGMEDEVSSVIADRKKLNVGDRVRIPDPAVVGAVFVNVGKVVKGCSVRITDDDNNLVGTNIIGHIQIKGDNVTSGYYCNEVATKEVLYTDGWLATGDLGFFKDECLYITGRYKDIIFVNGQNFYPPDLERLAEEIEGIRLNRVSVAGWFNDSTQREEAILFIVNRGSMDEFIPMARRVREHLFNKAGIGIERIIPVKDIPRTTSGKIQRFKLLEKLRQGDFTEELRPHQLMGRTVTGDPLFPEPETDVERRILQIGRKVLNNEALNVGQDLFSEGGNSLKSVELILLLQKEFNVVLANDVLYQKRTIKQLAISIQESPAQKYSPIPNYHFQIDYGPLSSAQKRLYYLWEADKTSLAYNIPVAFRISGSVDARRLQDGIRILCRRHDIFRTSFMNTPSPENPMTGDDGLIAKVAPAVDVDLAIYKYTDSGLGSVLKRLVQPFDLTQLPLFRAGFLRISESESVLFFDFHHIISDGISVRNFVEELFLLYQGREPQTPPLCYRDYVLWEKEYLRLEKFRQQEEYWSGHFKSGLPRLELPLDLSRPRIFIPQGEKPIFRFDNDITGRIRQLAAENGCTLHVLLFSLYNILLSTYTGQEEIVVGIPVAGRRHPDLQKMQGMFVNNLAIKSRIDGEEFFLQFLHRQRDLVNRCLDNQDYPFAELIRLVEDKRHSDRNPVFDSMFVFQNMGLPAMDESGITLSRMEIDPGISKFDLSMEIIDDGGPLEYGIEYSTNLFREETVFKMAACFTGIMDKAMTNPTCKIKELTAVSKPEYDKYIVDFNDTARDCPADKTIHRLFADQAARTPGNIAIEYEDQAITYEQLNEQANSLAHLLRRKGVGRDVVVGVCMQRSPELLISLLAILKAGGCYLPVEPDLPDERIGFLIANSRSKVILIGATEAPGADRFPDIEKIVVGQPGAEIPRDNGSDLPPEGDMNTPDDLAYIMYTSGTTGEPKGVMITHRSLVNYVWWAAENYLKAEEAAMPLFTSIAFDLTVTSIFAPLISGNRVVIYREDDRDISVGRVIEDRRTNVIKLTPSHLKLLLERRYAASLSNGCVKRFIVGGEKLDARLAKAIHDRCSGNVEIYNEYGPTEATVGCMIHRFDPERDLTAVPIGVPAANTQIYLLNKSLSPVPENVPGELFISGAGVSKGYLYRDELTAERFIPDPFRKGQKMYRTGDLARRLKEGILDYIGRTDQQVKINGYRIETSEIEARLNGYSGIAASIVVPKEDNNGRKRLVAYYVTDSLLPDGVNLPAVRKYLTAGLPFYMIPATFIPVDQIPLTKNGKVDVGALPDPDASGKDTREQVLPKNEIEGLFVKIWKEVLGEELLSVTENFFELGGDSIKAVQIASRLLDEGVSISVKDILRHQTIELISLHAKVNESARGYEQGPAKGEFGLTPIQSWFFAQKFRAPHFYNQSVLLVLKKKVRIDILEVALARVIVHHDGLRINYDPRKKELFYNDRHLTDRSSIREYAVNSDIDGERDLRAIFRSIKSGFDIYNGLLITAAIIRERVAPEMLFITAHHLLVDGISWRILLEDLYTAYQAIEQGMAVVLPGKTASLKDWDKASIAFNERVIQNEHEYWKKIGHIEFSIPQDHETDEWDICHSDTIQGMLDEERTRFLLKEAHKVYNTDVPILLNLCLVLALHEWTSLSGFIIEQEYHGRHLPDIDISRTVGWFTAMYPVWLELPDGPMDRQIKMIKEQMRNVPGHGVGYGPCNFNRTEIGYPEIKMAEIRFNYLGQFGKELNNDLFSYSRRPTGPDSDTRNRMTAKLEINAMVVDGRLTLDLRYNCKAHKQATVERLCDKLFVHLERVLEHIRGEDSLQFTPSDFNTAQLDDEALKTLFY